MDSFYDIFKFNNDFYYELTEEKGKKEIERCVNILKDTDLGYSLLELKGARINIRTFHPQTIEDPELIIDGISDVLLKKILKAVWG